MTQRDVGTGTTYTRWPQRHARTPRWDDGPQLPRCGRFPVHFEGEGNATLFF
jgi:hypothetical protein